MAQGFLTNLHVYLHIIFSRLAIYSELVNIMADCKLYLEFSGLMRWALVGGGGELGGEMC